MRDTDGLQTIINLGPVNRDGQTLALELGMERTLPMPDQDKHLPDRIEACVHRAGLELQRRLLRALLKKADQDLVLQRRHGKGGSGNQRRKTRPFTFKTIFGEVTVERSRISHKRDDMIEVPSATAWGTPHQLSITRNLRDAAWDPMLDRSAGESRADVCRYADDEDLLGRSTILEIVPEEGERLVAAERERARALLDDDPGARPAWIGSSDPDGEAGLLEDDEAPPCDASEGAEATWEEAQAEWAAKGFPGCEPMPPVAAGEPRAVAPGSVIVAPDAVTTQAPPATGRKEVWTFTAVVRVEGMQDAVAEATPGEGRG